MSFAGILSFTLVASVQSGAHLQSEEERRQEISSMEFTIRSTLSSRSNRFRRMQSLEALSEEMQVVLPIAFLILLLMSNYRTLVNVSEGSVIITVACATLIGLDELWDMFKSNKLKGVFEEAFLTDASKKQRLSLSVNMSRDDYLSCRQKLLTSEANAYLVSIHHLYFRIIFYER